MSSCRRASAIAPLLLLAVVPGAGGRGGDARDPEGFSYAAARQCSDVLNERDGERAAAGRAATVEVLAWHLGSTEPTDADREAVAADIEWYRDEVTRTRDALAELEPADAEDAATWAEYLETFDGAIDELTRRAEYARTLADSLAPGRGAADGDWQRREELVAELGLAGRDCETILAALGPLPGHRQFGSAAASACTTIVSRRLAGGYADDVGRVLDAVIAVRIGGLEPAADLESALGALVVEWEQTVVDLESVPTDDVPDAVAWADTLTSAAEALAVATARLEAVRSGDADALHTAFQPVGAGLWFAPELQLSYRDCRMTALRPG